MHDRVGAAVGEHHRADQQAGLVGEQERDERGDLLRTARSPERLRLITEAFVDFGITYPAFVDCGVTILRMGPALLDELSQSALFRLGKGMTDCLARVTSVIEAGRESGEFTVEDVDLVANMLYALGLGGLQLARLGVMVREGSPGVPVITRIDLAQVKRHLVESSLALVRQPL